MAVYKVIQDIEAEDKLLGPLTLRQFIYATIVIISLLAAYKLVFVKWFLPLPLVPIIVFFGLLAAPVGGQQSSEIWLLAKIRFFFKPRKRIWNQDGVLDLVTITAPKVVEKILTKNFSQTEVESRLQALANTIDSRGWAIKNVDTALYAQPVFGMAAGDSQRLMQIDAVPTDPGYDAAYGDDMLDEQNNPRAQRLDQMIQSTAQAKREELIDQMQQAAQAPVAPPTPEPMPIQQQYAAPQPQYAAPAVPAGMPPQNIQADYWFLGPAAAQAAVPPQPTATAPMPAPVTPIPAAPVQQVPIAPAPVPIPASYTPPVATTAVTPDEQALLDKIHNQQARPVGVENLPTLQPIGGQPVAPAATPQTMTPPPAPPMTTPPDPAILEYASNDDLNVETIQRLASKPAAKKSKDEEEVVVSLH